MLAIADLLGPAYPAWLHSLWDMASWLCALGVLLLIYRLRPQWFQGGTLGRAGRGYFIALSVGGLASAYLLGTANAWLSGHPAVSRSIVGGLFGAIVAVELYKRAKGLRGSTGGLFAPALTLGIALGRLGCHVAGLADFTYGTPTEVAWAVDHGDGIDRHPVALYESAAMGLWLVVLLGSLWRSPTWLPRRGFYWTCLYYAGQRFVWEFFKPYAAIIGPFNLFHLVCAALLGYAALMLLRDNHGPDPA